METISVAIKNKEVGNKVMSFLKDFENEGVEIINYEDIEDLKLLVATRQEESILFYERLKYEC
ncbi:MAG: hypothetical protein JRJ44_07810 [Deltaproteobacteria bacterium]|nr:hypothetical protein [Deltaproteobacteria bacterium]